MRSRAVATALLAASILTGASPVLAEPPDVPRPAKDLLAEATAAAGKGQKAVFVGFHASWCGWCRKLEKVLGSPGVKEAFDARFETVWLTVQERGTRKSLINPGAPELYRLWSGKDDVGLPFYGFLDASGKLLASSARGPDGKPAENIGYPGEAPNFDRFVGLLKKASPGLAPAEVDAYRAAFAPKAP